jgi:hypothetical protein
MKQNFCSALSSRFFTAITTIACSLGGSGVMAQTQTTPSPALPTPPPVIPGPIASIRSEAPSPAALKIIGPGIFELGSVRLNKQQRTVSFPALLNTNMGPQEYFLVTRYGKAHESVLLTDTEPYHIQVAMLLLDATGAGTNTLLEAPSPQVKNPSQKTLPGDKISIEVSWSLNGKEIRHPAEQLVYNEESKSTMRGGTWVYNGSSVWDGKFLAQQDGSIISLVTDATALANNFGSGRDIDKTWTSNTNSLPPANVPVQVTFKLLSKATK